MIKQIIFIVMALVTISVVTANTVCYQETANKSSGTDGSCGLNYSGKYNWTSHILTPLNLYDGNWSSSSTSDGQEAYVYINYSKPVNSQYPSFWQDKHRNGRSTTITQNTSIISECFLKEPIELRMQFAGRILAECYNGTSWKQLWTIETYEVFYEEAMWWNVTESLPDLISPTWITIPNNTTLVYNYDILKVLFNATDNVNISTYFINDTTNFKINATGYLENNTILNLGTYYINVSVNDTSNNVNSTFYQVDVVNSESSFNVLFPIGYSSIIFNITNLYSYNNMPLGQSDIQPMISITNTGNQNLNISLRLNQTLNNNIIFKVSNNSNPNEALPIISNLTSICYQESANVSTYCGGVGSGKYGQGNFTNMKWDDGNWNTEASSPSGNSYGYINYTKPLGYSNTSLWQVKDDGGTVNITIIQDCWDADNSVLKLRVTSQISNSAVAWDCQRTSGAWALLRGDFTSDQVYEEAMWWNITTSNELVINSYLPPNNTSNYWFWSDIIYSIPQSITNNMVINSTII